MNFRKIMFFILCMLTARCHAGFFIPLRLETQGSQFWISNNYLGLPTKSKKTFRQRLKKRLETESALTSQTFKKADFSHTALELCLSNYPFVIASGNDADAVMKFMVQINRKYQTRIVPSARCDKSSNFMYLYIIDGIVTFYFYGCEQK